MAKKTKNDIIKDLLQELNAIKSFYGRTDISEAEKQAQAIVDKSEPVIDYENLQTKFYYTLEEYKDLVKNNKLPPMSHALAVTVYKDRKKEQKEHDTFVYEQGHWDYNKNVDDGFYNGFDTWFGNEMKPIGIVVNDCVSVYPEHIQTYIKEIYGTNDIDRKLSLVTGLLADFKKFLPKCHNEIKYSNGSRDFIGEIEVALSGDSHRWPGILTEFGVIEFQRDGKFYVFTTSGCGNHSKYDISSIQDAMNEAKSTITRNGIDCVKIRLHGKEDQLGHNFANKKAQADFLKRMGYEKQI